MDASIKRFADEDENQYIYRVCQMKEAIGTWQDVADILNSELGHNYDESAYRKKYAAFDLLYNANIKNFTDAESFEKLRQLKDELREERYKIQALNLASTRELRQKSRVDLFCEQIAEKVKSVSYEPLETEGIEINEEDDEYVLTIADIHYGANFKTATNEYSREEAERRLSELLGYVSFYVSLHDIPVLNVVCLGDTIQGILRYTDLKLNEAPVVDCVVEVANLIGRFLDGLSKFCCVNYYHVPTANHSQTRPLGSKASEIATEDMEKIVVAIIQSYLKNNERVRVFSNTGNDRIAFQVAGFNCVATHGHTIKDVDKCVKDLSAKDRIFYDYVFIGHYHGGGIIPAGEDGCHNLEVLACPSIVGTDPYADSLLAGSKSAAKLFRFNKVNGHVGEEIFILN